MKKIFSISMFIIISCLIVSGCENSLITVNTSSSTNNSSGGKVEVLRDFSVELEKVCNIPESESNILEVVSETDEFYGDDLSDSIEASDNVVRATVQDVSYTSCEGVAWTKSDVLITDTFKGNLKVGDVISVFTLGGYISLSDHIKENNDAFRFSDMSAKEIKNTVLKETVNGEKSMASGDDLILCVIQTLDDSPLPDGAYERVSYSGQLYAESNGESEEFVQANDDDSSTEEKTYSYDDIQKMTSVK